MPNEDRDFARAALARKYITHEQAKDGLETLAKMREMGLQESLGGVLIKKGYMNRAQVDAVVKANGLKNADSIRAGQKLFIPE